MQARRKPITESEIMAAQGGHVLLWPPLILGYIFNSIVLVYSGEGMYTVVKLSIDVCKYVRSMLYFG